MNSSPGVFSPVPDANASSDEASPGWAPPTPVLPLALAAVGAPPALHGPGSKALAVSRPPCDLLVFGRTPGGTEVARAHCP